LVILRKEGCQCLVDGCSGYGFIGEADIPVHERTFWAVGVKQYTQLSIAGLKLPGYGVIAGEAPIEVSEVQIGSKAHLLAWDGGGLPHQNYNPMDDAGPIVEYGGI